VQQTKKGAANRSSTVVARNVRALRESLGLGQNEFSAILGVKQSQVSKWELGKNQPREPRIVSKLADMAGMSIPQFMGYGAGPVRAARQVRVVRLVGELQANAWKDALEWDFESQPEERVPYAEELPDVPLKAYRINGQSMNRMFPNGSIVFVAPLSETGLSLESGMPVHVSRRNRDGLYENTIKEYVVDADGSKWLWPRSSDPEHQAPIAYRQNKAERVTIAGMVLVATIKVFQG